MLVTGRIPGLLHLGCLHYLIIRVIHILHESLDLLDLFDLLHINLVQGVTLFLESLQVAI